MINARPDRLRAYNFSPDELVSAMAQANIISPSGNMNLGDKYPIVPVNAVVKNVKDLEMVPLRVNDTGAVFLRDVATVEDGSDIVTSYALVNGRRTVYIPVTKRADASTLTVVQLVKSNLARFQSVLPEDVKVSFEFDQTPVVVSSIKNLLREGGLGAILTGFTVLLFLRDWRTAFVVVINIPVSLLAAAFALWISGQNVNLMTLGGLALAVGVLVDEATVAIENIHTHLARGSPLALAAQNATVETALPRLLAMLCILAVFTPALFMTGAAKALFTPLALAVAFSMVASFLLSSTLVPIFSIWLLRNVSGGHHESSFFGPIQGGYSRLLPTVLAARWPLLLFYLAGAGLVIWILGMHLGEEIFPRGDSGQFALRLRAPTGTKVENTEALALKVLEIVKREAGPDNVALTMGLVGVHAANYPVNLIHLWNGGPEEGWLAVQLKHGVSVRVEDLKERLRGVFAREMPELRISFEPSDIVSRVMSFGSDTPITVAVSGPDLAASREHAEKISQKLHEIPALRDIQFVQALDYPTIDVEVNRERAGLMGVKVSEVTRSLVAATTSSRFTTANYWADPKSGVAYNLQIQIPQSKTTSIEDLKNVPVATKAGDAMLLRNLARITPGTAVGQYERYNMARVVSISANIHGSDLGTVAREIERKLAEAGAPPARTNVTLRGQIVPLRELIDGFRSGLLVAMVVVFLLLTANFQSLRLSLVVVSTLPAAIAGVALALWLTRTTLNIQSGIGAIMAVGVAVANAILLVTFAERARTAGGESRAAALEGATSRLRPILMTSLAMFAGMLPMALGFGEGGDQSAPLGRAVIGGLIAATFSTLFILPAVFTILLKNADRRSKSLDASDPESALFVSTATNPAAAHP